MLKSTMAKINGKIFGDRPASIRLRSVSIKCIRKTYSINWLKKRKKFESDYFWIFIFTLLKLYLYYWCYTDTGSFRARVHGPNGRVLCRLCRPVRIRSGTVRAGPTHAWLSQWSGQFAWVLEILLSTHEGAVVHLWERNETRTHVALSFEAARIRLLYHGTNSWGDFDLPDAFLKK